MASRLGVDAASWARLSPLLDEALELPEDQRAAWLLNLTEQHHDLRPELERLLARSAPRLRTQWPFAGLQDAARREGDLLGPYRLLRVLGVGGMGEVWLAERADGQLRREVALKLPHLGGERNELGARMARERDILAALVHGNIARLYDAGLTADGQPYLALELVQGERIDEHARARRLDLAARLRLFLQAARAVAYAHAQLVVHRDLKPSNLLVDGQGQVKLLDFGIAKLLAPEPAAAGELTEHGSKLMTPGYASPEQVAGQAVGTRSDVYALGVLLYELLAGTSPYRPASPSRAALEAAVLTADPLRPSEATAAQADRAALRGDLDTIVLKALKKDPDERYATVDALADDIERHLQCRPVLARPDSLAYTLRKWVQRRRLAFGAAGAVVVAVLAGTGVALWQAQVAVIERQRADQVKDFFVAILRDASPYRGTDATRLTAVDLVHQAGERLAQTPIRSPQVRAEIGNLLGESLFALGDVDHAETLLSATVGDARRQLGDGHEQTLRARLQLAQVHRFRGRADVQQRELAELLPMLRAGARSDPALPVVGLQHLTMNAIDRGAYAEAEQAALEGLALASSTLGERHVETVASSILLAMAHRYAGHFAPARAAAERALWVTRSVYPGPAVHPRVVEAQSVLGRALADVGELQAGVAQLQAAVRDAHALFGPDSPMTGTLQQNQVAYQIDLGELQAAEDNARDALRVVALHAQPESYAYAATAASHGAALLARRRLPQALSVLGPASETLVRVLGPGHDATLAVQANLALALALSGRVDEAGRVLSALAERLAAAHVTPATRARATYAQAVVERLGGNPQAAAARLRPLLAATDPAPRLQRERMRARIELGLDLLQMGQAGEAAAAFDTARAEIALLETGATPAQADALDGLARAHAALGQAADAQLTRARRQALPTP